MISKKNDSYYLYYPPNGVNKLFLLKLNVGALNKLNWWDDKGWEWKVYNWLNKKGKLERSVKQKINK